MNFFLEKNKVIIKEKEIPLRRQTATLQTPRSLEKEENDKYNKNPGLITYKKIVEARGEYQTTRYSTSKPLNGNYGNEIRVLLPPPTEPPQLQLA